MLGLDALRDRGVQGQHTASVRLIVCGLCLTCTSFAGTDDMRPRRPDQTSNVATNNGSSTQPTGTVELLDVFADKSHSVQPSPNSQPRERTSLGSVCGVPGLLTQHMSRAEILNPNEGTDPGVSYAQGWAAIDSVIASDDPQENGTATRVSLPDAPSESLHKLSDDIPAQAGLRFTEIDPPSFRIDPQPPRARRKIVDCQFIILSLAQLGAVIADVESTEYGLSHGSRESNPLAGPRPSRGMLYGISVPVSVGLTYWSYHLKQVIPHSRRWQSIPIITGAIHVAATVHNLAISHTR